jgi:hypothetical protein
MDGAKPLTELLQDHRAADDEAADAAADLASFAFNFNNFVLIQLLTERPAGHHQHQAAGRAPPTSW